MNTLTGRGVFGGRGSGPALVTRMPMNFTAAFTKLANLLPSKRSEIQDRHHELYKKKIKGKVGLGSQKGIQRLRKRGRLILP